MGAKSRRKGQSGEREAAAEIRRVLGADAHRGRQYHGGADAPDVKTDIPGLHIEVKRAETFRLYPALEQATGDAGGKLPLVLHRRNLQPWVAVVYLDDLPRLAEILGGIRADQTTTGAQ